MPCARWAGRRDDSGLTDTSGARVLLTAFEPFGGAGVNASEEAARYLAADGRITLAVLPVVRGIAVDRALAALRRMQTANRAPNLIVSLGEAGPEPVIRLEKVAVNWDDFRIPDNGGNTPRDTVINAQSSAPHAHFATVPVARIAANLANRTPLPVQVSLSAGAFVCNHLAYAVSEALATKEEGGSMKDETPEPSATDGVSSPSSSFILPPSSFVFVHVPRWRPGGPGGEAGLHAIVATVGAVIEEALRLVA